MTMAVQKDHIIRAVGTQNMTQLLSTTCSVFSCCSQLLTVACCCMLTIACCCLLLLTVSVVHCFCSRTSTFSSLLGRRRLLVTGGLGLWLKMGVSVWRSLRHIGCLWSAFQAFPATPLVHALINVGGGMYVPYPTH